MENKSTEQLNVGLPPYCASPHPLLPRKKWIVGISIVLLLAVIIATATLTGLYLSQEHTEKMATMAIGSQDGPSFQQTILVNDREDVVVIFVTTPKYSDTLLFDYKRRIIGIRRSNSTTCALLRMDDFRTPSVAEILKTINHFQSHDDTSPTEKISFLWRPEKEARPSDLGINARLLCSGVPVYWAQGVRAESRRADTLIKFDFTDIINGSTSFGLNVWSISFNSDVWLSSNPYQY